MSLYKDGTRLTTCTFYFKVVRSIVTDDGVVEDSRFPILDGLIIKAQQLATRVEEGFNEYRNRLVAHSNSNVLDHPDGSVTDAKIGNRTIQDPDKATGTKAGTLTTLLNSIVSAVRKKVDAPLLTNELAKKVDKTGGVITGDVEIEGLP